MNHPIGGQERKEGAGRRCASIAARQYGLITRQQALHAGLSRRALELRITAGRLEPVYRGIYRVPQVPQSWRQRLLAACLWSGGVASHRAAAALWKLGSIEEGVVEITSSKKLSSQKAIVHCASLPSTDVTSTGSIPATTPTRTLLDLGAVAETGILEACLADALRRHLTTLHRLYRALDEGGGKGRRGSKALRCVLETIDNRRVESILEIKLLRLLRQAKLPQPATQFCVWENELVLARVDFAYPEIKLAIEADGYRYHGPRRAWERDLRRRNLLTSRGWHVMHVTWDDVTTRPGDLVNEIAAAIENLSGPASFFPS